MLPCGLQGEACVWGQAILARSCHRAVALHSLHGRAVAAWWAGASGDAYLGSTTAVEKQLSCILVA